MKAHESIKGSCAQCYAICATDRSYGRPFTVATRPATDFFPARDVLLCECCDNPRDPSNVIAREAAAKPSARADRLAEKSRKMPVASKSPAIAAARKLAQPHERVTSPLRMVTCRVHRSVHRERVTCIQPRAD